MRLSEKDYDKILKFYKIKTRKTLSRKKKRQISEKLLSEKLCGCIKKIKKTQKRKEKDIVPICKHSVLRKKGLIGQRFTCKTKKSILLRKIKQNKTRKQK